MMLPPHINNNSAFLDFVSQSNSEMILNNDLAWERTVWEFFGQCFF